MFRILVILALGIFVSELASAREFRNGKFTEGRDGWQGDAQAVILNLNRSLAESSPAMQIKLSKVQFRELSQKFTTPKAGVQLNGEVIFKASADFVINAKSPRYSKDIILLPGTTYYWNVLLSPKADLLVRVDRPEGFAYISVKVTPGTDDQSLKFSVNITAGSEVVLHIITPPGDGDIIIKSVSLDQASSN